MQAAVSKKQQELHGGAFHRMFQLIGENSYQPTHNYNRSMALFSTMQRVHAVNTTLERRVLSFMVIDATWSCSRNPFPRK